MPGEDEIAAYVRMRACVGVRANMHALYEACVPGSAAHEGLVRVQQGGRRLDLELVARKRMHQRLEVLTERERMEPCAGCLLR